VTGYCKHDNGPSGSINGSVELLTASEEGLSTMELVSASDDQLFLVSVHFVETLAPCVPRRFCQVIFPVSAVALLMSW